MTPGCSPVLDEIGPETDMVHSPDFIEVFNGIADQEVAVRVHLSRHTGEFGEEMNNGKAAQIVERDLGCAACELSDICLVKSALDAKIETGKDAESKQNVLDRIENDRKLLDALPTKIKLAYKNEITNALSDKLRSESLAYAVWGLEIKPEGTATKVSIKEISTLSAIAADAELPKFSVKTVDGLAFDLIDASAAVGGCDAVEDFNTLNILFDKLFICMKEKAEGGGPKISLPDGNMIKRINTVKSDVTYEVRIAGSKGRLYYTYTKGDGGNSGRVVFLGNHRNNADAQSDFINLIRE